MKAASSTLHRAEYAPPRRHPTGARAPCSIEAVPKEDAHGHTLSQPPRAPPRLLLSVRHLRLSRAGLCAERGQPVRDDSRRADADPALLAPDVRALRGGV